MKKLLISILTFILGICAVFVWFNSKSNELVRKANSPIILEEKCVETKNFLGLSQEIAEIEKGKSGYFPTKILSNSELLENLYSDYLKAADEKSLLDISDKDLEVYRFTWLRSFHHPIVVIIQKQSGKIKTVFKELDSAGGTEPGKLIVQKEISINENDWCKFKEFLNDTNYANQE